MISMIVLETKSKIDGCGGDRFWNTKTAIKKKADEFVNSTAEQHNIYKVKKVAFTTTACI